MKVFLSWSGEISHAVACSFRTWLPVFIQGLDPYVSSEYIDKGTRWSVDIARELEQAQYGIICVTSENANEPWLNFEAGALSKSMDDGRVSPFLLNVSPAQLPGTLVQFQATKFNKEDVETLVNGINGHMAPERRVAENILTRTFQQFWPQFEAELVAVGNVVTPNENAAVPKPDINDIVNEILTISRSTFKRVVEMERAASDALSEPKLDEYLRSRKKNLRGRYGDKLGFLERLLEDPNLSMVERKQLMNLYRPQSGKRRIDDDEVVSPEEVLRYLRTQSPAKSVPPKPDS